MKTITLLALAAALAFAHEPHHDAVDRRGDHVMGYSHEKTTHHFRVLPGGGAIEVTANDAKDTESRDQIRMHLRHIAKMFADGNFEAPMLIHDRTPPGVPTMQRLKAEIQYTFEEIDRGARVRITTSNGDAIAAIHEFLASRSPTTAPATINLS